MKKLLLSLVVIFTVTLLSACGLKENFQSDSSLSSIAGVLAEQTQGDKESGTHFLIDETGKKVAVRSLTINLSGDEYLSNKVKALGMMNTSDNVFEITGITVEEIFSKNTKQNKQVEYKDTDAGFSLSYFNDWESTVSKDKSVVFTSPLATGSKAAAVVTITQKPFAYDPKMKEDGTLISALEVYYEQANEGKVFDKNLLSKIGVDQMDALKNVASGKTSYTLYRSGLIYEVSFVPADPVNPDDEINFNKMIADFRFISLDSEDDPDHPDVPLDASPVTSDLPKLSVDMTGFESLPYQFSGQYPAKWYYAGVKSSSDGILHHYGFSDDVANTKEIIGLDVLSNGIPGGSTKLSFNGKGLDVFETGSTYTVYTALNDRNFRITGPVEQKDLILVMAANLFSIEKDKKE
jgi:hypothetical protein